MRPSLSKLRSDTKRGGSVELSRFFYKKIKLLGWIFLGLVLFSGSSDAFRGAFQDGIYAYKTFKGHYDEEKRGWFTSIKGNYVEIARGNEIFHEFFAKFSTWITW